MKAKGGSQLRVPNDEAFVSSELCEAGFSCKDLNFYEQDLYCRDTFRFRKPIPEIFFRNNPPDNRIYHPVVDDNDFIAVLKKRFQFLEQRHDMNRLKNETDYGKLGKLKDLIQKYFGPSAVNTLEQECPTLLNTWS
ncbi:hypothetical protein GCM10007886_03210 [Methylobacterium gregans]|nr:hypothetical protein GCM10007886_03210 [Methylobacterium gregans]